MTALRTLLATALLLGAASLAQPTPALAATHVLPANQVMVSSTTGDALVIWDASNYIQNAATNKVSKAQVMTNIQTLAGKLLLEKAQTFTPDAKTVTVRVMYAPTVLIELYKTATFQGFEKLMTVSASRADAVAQQSAWLSILSSDKVPHGMTVSIFGSLPAAWN
jgi:hypothetical protein